MIVRYIQSYTSLSQWFLYHKYLIGKKSLFGAGFCETSLADCSCGKAVAWVDDELFAIRQFPCVCGNRYPRGARGGFSIPLPMAVWTMRPWWHFILCVWKPDPRTSAFLLINCCGPDVALGSTCTLCSGWPRTTLGFTSSWLSTLVPMLSVVAQLLWFNPAGS